MLESEERGDTGLFPAACSQAVAVVLKTLTHGCRCCQCCQCLSRAVGEHGKEEQSSSVGQALQGSSRLVSRH